MISTVEFCGLEVSRLMVGGNPFSGFSHQGPERDEEMVNYYTPPRIKETLQRAEASGITTAVLRSDDHIEGIMREYYDEGGRIQWLVQVGVAADEFRAHVARAVRLGAKAANIHGGTGDKAYAERDLDALKELIGHVHDHGIPAGIGSHSADAHRWMYEAGVPADFHVVSFYNCGSLHHAKGEKFDPQDPPLACEVIREIEKPCIGYKIMGGGRVDAEKALEFAFANIKRGDCVNVGIYRGDNDNMVEENAATVAEILRVDCGDGSAGGKGDD